jgi:hypothetical protein
MFVRAIYEPTRVWGIFMCNAVCYSPRRDVGTTSKSRWGPEFPKILDFFSRLWKTL